MVAALCGLLLAGCVTVPTSGHVQSVNVTQGGSGGGQYYLQPIPVPPGHGWSPQQIVSGFLAANASFASGHAVAREYLIPSASRTWHPGWAVKVFGQSPSIVTPVRSPYSGKTAATTVVEVSGPVLGSVSDSGQYAISSQGQSAAQEKFQLVRQNGEWRISSLPSVVLLTQADFVHVYQPRDIYFFDPAMNVLLPDPVYVPQAATPADLMTQLLQVLLAAPSGWLLDAAQTAFPARTRLLNVSLDGGTAIVNLSGPVAGASDQALRQMFAQLLWTLAGLQFGPAVDPVGGAGGQRDAADTGRAAEPRPADRHLRQLRPLRPRARQLLLRRQPRGGALAVRHRRGQRAAGGAGARPGRDGTDPAHPGRRLTRGHYVAGLGPGGALYTGRPTRSATLAQRANGPFTSLSWDSHDDLWATGSTGRSGWCPGAAARPSRWPPRCRPASRSPR